MYLKKADSQKKKTIFRKLQNKIPAIEIPA